MHVILASMGSLGDTLPFIALGRAMRERGHRVTLIGSARFLREFPNEGFEYAESLTEEQYQTFLEGQVEWKGMDQLAQMGDLMLDQIPKIYQLIADRYVPGQTIVVAQGYAFGARVANEKLGVPLATVHLQPIWFRSIYDPVDVADWVPRGVMRGLDWIFDLVLDIGLAKRTNAFRRELGLPPVHRLMKKWWNSPQLVVGMFPEWFNPPQPDYPPNTELVGFALPTVRDDETVSPELERFLQAGDPPILFMQTVVSKLARPYFETSLEVARRLRRRAILVTPHREQVPEQLPDDVAWFKFVPLDKMLDRCAFHVHHGGIGTIAHTLAAGVPQLTVPMGYDQPDNSKRLLRLGVSRLLLPKQYRVDSAVQQISELLESREVRERCVLFARRCAADDAYGRCADLFERMCAQPVPC